MVGESSKGYVKGQWTGAPLKSMILYHIDIKHT